MRPSGPRALVLAGEAVLGALTLAAVLGMSRLFDGGGWLGPVAANAVAAHVMVTVLRRRGLSLPATAAVMVPVAVLVMSWTSYWSTTTAGLPTGTTWSTTRSDLADAWTLYQQVVAPTPAQAGFVVATSGVVWLIAYVADWAAFRLWVPFEATLPAGTLFLFTALLGTERGRTWSVGLFATGVVGFLLLHRLARQEGSSHWVAGRTVPGRRSILAAGATVGAIAVITGTVFGPSLPGADATAFVDLGTGNTGTRITVSPLVDIKSRLVDQSSRELFRVQSTEPAYWRLTSLDRFTGEVWSSSSSYDDAEGDLPLADELSVAAESVDQTFTVEALAAIWLPSAFVPRSFDPVTDAAVLFDERSATLIVDREVDTSDGLVYEITSQAPRVTAEDLSSGTGELPGDIEDRYLDLPDDFSPRVRALAEDLVRDAATPYEAARRLQDHLRQFTYDLAVQRGHSGDVLETFLFELQRGYCEQFAGAYAAMARAVGLPARVAVGFTQGESDPEAPGTYIVRGEHAHAWPEVYLAGAGWVSFEPTPGRGQPFTESYTGVAPAQAASGDPGTSATLPPTTIAPAIPSDGTPGQRPVQNDLETIGVGETDPDGGRADRSLVHQVLVGAVIVAAVAGGLLVTHLIAFPLWLLLRRRWRRRAAVEPPARVTLAWNEAADAGRMVGYVERPSRTPSERAAQLSGRLPEVADAAHELGRLLEEATYSEDGADELAAELAEEASVEVQAAARRAARRRGVLAHWLDPRPHLQSRRLRRQAAQRHITTTVRADLEAEREMVGSADR